MQPPAQVDSVADVERLLVVTAEQIDARLAVESRRLEAVPGLKSREVALGEHEVVLLRLRRPTRGSLCEAAAQPSDIATGSNPAAKRFAIRSKIRRLLGIAENFVERRAANLSLVSRQAISAAKL